MNRIGKIARIAAFTAGILALAKSGLTATNETWSPATITPLEPSSALSALQETNLPALEVAQAVMVTVELDFGKKIPSIAEALREIERHYQPEDGRGRTFAILDAYGGPTPDGKLHISMHVSSEKTGIAALVFRRTGETLWKTRIVPATHPPSSSFAGKQLFIMVDDGAGKPYLLDGSKGAHSVMDSIVRDLSVPVRDFWPNGAEREITFFYSACGCPVKVMAKRVGEKTTRITDLPVVFPDDPAVVASITLLFRWDKPQTLFGKSGRD